MARDPKQAPRVGSVWRPLGTPEGTYGVVGKVEHLVGTEGRFLILMRAFNGKHEPVIEAHGLREWYSDSDFGNRWRRVWTRYDMIADDDLFDVED